MLKLSSFALAALLIRDSSASDSLKPGDMNQKSSPQPNIASGTKDVPIFSRVPSQPNPEGPSVFESATFWIMIVGTVSLVGAGVLHMQKKDDKVVYGLYAVAAFLLLIGMILLFAGEDNQIASVPAPPEQPKSAAVSSTVPKVNTAPVVNTVTAAAKPVVPAETLLPAEKKKGVFERLKGLKLSK